MLLIINRYIYNLIYNFFQSESMKEQIFDICIR